MKIAIIGATGGSGRHFLDIALEEGHSIRALARTPEKLSEYNGRVEIVPGDGREEASLVAALSPGFDAIVSIVGASNLRQARKVTDLYSVTTSNLLSAMNKTKHERLIVVSSSGVEPQENDGWFYRRIFKPLFLAPMYADMLRMEAILAESDVNYTIVRPPYLTKGAPTGNYRISVGANFRDDKTLSRGNLAHFLLRAVRSPGEFASQTVALSN